MFLYTPLVIRQTTTAVLCDLSLIRAPCSPCAPYHRSSDFHTHPTSFGTNCCSPQVLPESEARPLDLFSA